MALGDPYLPPVVRWDHDDTSGCCHAVGIPINNHPVCGPMGPADWRDRVVELIGICSPDVGPNNKDKKPSDVHYGWPTTNFHTCPEGANDGVVQMYARAWLWHMVVGFLFSDKSRNITSWLVLPVLHPKWDMIATYRWGRQHLLAISSAMQ
jgi:hypothetical protein